MDFANIGAIFYFSFPCEHTKSAYLDPKGSDKTKIKESEEKLKFKISCSIICEIYCV